MRRFGKHDGIRTRADVSQDGKLLLTSGMNGVLRMWDLESGELVHELSCEERECYQIEPLCQ